MSNNNNIELRSEEVREILGSPPGWIIRSSISVILLIIIALLIGSFFYKYPDLIVGRVTIVSQNPPIPIVAKSSGRIDLMFVTDGQIVFRGQDIGVIENPAIYNDMKSLKTLLDSIDYFINPQNSLNSISFPKILSLGQCQSYYSSLVSQWNEFQNYIQLDYLGQQIKSLSLQIQDYNKYLTRLVDQTEILKKDFILNERQLRRDSVLFSRGVMSEVQYEQSQQSHYKQEYNYKNSVTNLSNTRIQIKQLKQQILEIGIQKTEQERKLLANLKERYDNLMVQFEIWKQTYVLTSPIEGKVAFTELWSEKQHVQVGTNVFTIVPDMKQEVIGKVVVPVAGSGKVEIGQAVNIKLDNFPYMEYGLIESAITNISMIPVKSTDGGAYYIAEVSLLNGLVTNYKKELPLIQEMQGNVEIVTKDRRLIERFIQPIISIFKENIQ